MVSAYGGPSWLGFSKTARFPPRPGEAARNPGRRRLISELGRRLAHQSVEGADEGAQTPITDSLGDLCHWQRSSVQHPLGALNPSAVQILMRSLPERCPESTCEMRRRHPRHSSDFSHIQRLGEPPVHRVPRPEKPASLTFDLHSVSIEALPEPQQRRAPGRDLSEALADTWVMAQGPAENRSRLSYATELLGQRRYEPRWRNSCGGSGCANTSLRPPAGA